MTSKPRQVRGRVALRLLLRQRARFQQSTAIVCISLRP